MKKYSRICIAVAATALLATGACKTSEANYRQAYERATVGRDSANAIESTIYGAHRRDMGSRVVVIGTDSATVRTQRVAITEGGGAIRENLRPFNVVVGQFKQLFNAKSLRERLVDEGYPETFVVNTAEPYYYVVLSSHADVAGAVKALKSLPTNFPVKLREPLPFIMQTAY